MNGTERAGRGWDAVPWLPVVVVAALIGLWQAAVWLLRPPVWLLPSPVDVLRALIRWKGTLPVHILTTLYETLAGFTLAVMVAVPISVVMASSRIAKNIVYPILLALQSVPKIAIAPLLLIWVGYGEPPKIIVAFLVCFFPIVVSTTQGLDAVPQDWLDLARSLSATPRQILFKIRFPSAMPYMFVGFKVAMTLAVMGAVIGEFVGSERGLGYLILISSSQAETALAFGAMLLLAVLSVSLYFIVELVERLVIPWAKPLRRDLRR